MRIIAEVASAHCGDVGKMRALIDHAIKAGFDGIKFQVWSISDLKHCNVYTDRLAEIVLTQSTWWEIFNLVPGSLELWCEVYGYNGFTICKRHADHIKVHGKYIYTAPKWTRGQFWEKATSVRRKAIIGIQDKPTTFDTTIDLLRAIINSSVPQRNSATPTTAPAIRMQSSPAA